MSTTTHDKPHESKDAPKQQPTTPPPPEQPPKPPVKAPKPADFSAQFASTAGGPPGSTKPTEEALIEQAYLISDDVSWYVWRDDAVRQGYGSFEANYEAYCKQQPLGTVPHRIHNVAPNNIWGYPDDKHAAGIPCVYNNPQPLPPYLEQWQIDAINSCANVQAVVFAKPPLTS